MFGEDERMILMVNRDGIEMPTPAFSGTDSPVPRGTLSRSFAIHLRVFHAGRQRVLSIAICNSDVGSATDMNHRASARGSSAIFRRG